MEYISIEMTGLLLMGIIRWSRNNLYRHTTCALNCKDLWSLGLIYYLAGTVGVRLPD